LAPDLLGTVALPCNATVHTATGYSQHELFYSFSPSCPLDAMVTVPPTRLRTIGDRAFPIAAEKNVEQSVTGMDVIWINISFQIET